MISVIGAVALASAVTAAPLPLQQAATRALGNRAGCVVALDPRDGRLLALVNPRMAVGTAYPVGSLAKLVTAMAGVSSGVADGSRVFTCRGRAHGRTCWHVHGRVGLEEAIAQSCSLYFFRVGLDLGPERLTRAFRSAGFGQSTQSGLAGERAGSLRPPRTRSQLEDLAYGDTAALLATPLQVACFTGALANGGVLMRPHVDPAPARALGRIGEARAIAPVQAGMRRAVLSGSAREADVPALALFGKTGTSTQLDAPHRRHGWFAGYAAGLAVVAFVKHGTGYADAAPVARRVFEAWQP